MTMTMTMTREALRRSSLDELEAQFCQAIMGPVPTQRYRGEVLHRVDTPFARTLTASLLMLPFERMGFGVDFSERDWFFLDPRLHLGRFRMEPGPSRWRDTSVLRLVYDASRLPFRGLLYDEVKPLSDSLCLGLGGINRGPGQGELFFFLLEADPL